MCRSKRVHLFWIAVMVLAIAFFAFGSVVSHAASEPKKIRVGLLLGLTGWFSVAGNMELGECKAAAEMVNDKGGIIIKGEKYLIELVPEDIKSSNEGTTAAVNKLIYDDKIQFIVGPTAFWGPASAPLCEANKMINVLGYSANTPGTLDKNTQYRILGENGTMGHVYALIKYIKKNYPNVKSVVIVNADDGAVPYLKPLIAKALQENGISVAGDWVVFANEMVDFSPIASKIAAQKADAIFFPNGIDRHVGPIVKGIREQGDERWLFHSGVTACSDVKTLAGAGARKVVTLAPMQGAPGNPPQLEEFMKRYMAMGAKRRVFILQNSEATYVLPQILQAAQSLNADDILKALPKMSNFETLWGPGHVGGEKTYGVKRAVIHPMPAGYIDEKGDIKFGSWITDVDVP